MCEGACESHAAKQALASTTTAFPAEFLAASEAVGGLPPQLQCLTEFLEEEVLEEAARRRESRRAAKEENRRARAASEAAASSMAPATIVTQPPTAQQPAAQQPEMETVADKEVQRANEEARERKRLMKKAAVQPSLSIPTAAADEAAGPGAPAEAAISKNARRRREKKAKQQRTGQRRAEEKQQRADDEFRSILKQVEPLRHESGTVVKQDLQCLESVRALDAALQKEEKQAKAKPRRESTRVEAEVAHALLDAASWAAGCARRWSASSRPFPGLRQTQAPSQSAWLTSCCAGALAKPTMCAQPRSSTATSQAASSPTTGRSPACAWGATSSSAPRRSPESWHGLRRALVIRQVTLRALRGRRMRKYARTGRGRSAVSM